MTARVLMIQGTGSGVGKSTLLAGLARAFTRRGLKVLPFKPQNMSNNAAVTADGGEIGRAQALQALACGVQPEVDMNPVLLKPQGETGAQLVVHGHVLETVEARQYQSRKDRLMPEVLKSFWKLAAQADLVLVEGAGSASEVNLRMTDIANMGFAQAVQAPVVLVGDIDRGGVIASLVGTQVVIAPEDAALIKGFIVNKMRGDTSLFYDGMEVICGHTGWAALGLVPDLPAVRYLPAEDASDLNTDQSREDIHTEEGGGEGYTVPRLRVVVPLLPLIANFDDLDPLRAEPAVDLIMVRPGTRLPECDLVILPGSKGSLSDLMVFRSEGWEHDLQDHLARGGHVMGICGGYQMLGHHIADPKGVEGDVETVAGLGLLDVETVLTESKHLVEKKGIVSGMQASVSGYEMHLGETDGAGCRRPLLELDGQPEGAVSASGQVYGTYLHGIFGSRDGRMALLSRAGGADFTPGGFWYEQEDGFQKIAHHDMIVEDALNSLADHLEHFIDLDALLDLASYPVTALQNRNFS